MLTQAEIKKKEREIGWTSLSQFSERQDDVGECAEKNGGTDRCVPGNCELCQHCSFYPENKKMTEN